MSSGSVGLLHPRGFGRRSPAHKKFVVEQAYKRSQAMLEALNTGEVARVKQECAAHIDKTVESWDERIDLMKRMHSLQNLGELYTFQRELILANRPPVKRKYSTPRPWWKFW